MRLRHSRRLGRRQRRTGGHSRPHVDEQDPGSDGFADHRAVRFSRVALPGDPVRRGPLRAAATRKARQYLARNSRGSPRLEATRRDGSGRRTGQASEPGAVEGPVPPQSELKDDSVIHIWSNLVLPQAKNKFLATGEGSLPITVSPSDDSSSEPSSYSSSDGDFKSTRCASYLFLRQAVLGTDEQGGLQFIARSANSEDPTRPTDRPSRAIPAHRGVRSSKYPPLRSRLRPTSSDRNCPLRRRCFPPPLPTHP